MRVLLVGHSLPRGYKDPTQVFPDASARWYCKSMEVEDIHDWMDTLNLVNRDGMSEKVTAAELRAGATRVAGWFRYYDYVLFAGTGVAKWFKVEIPGKTLPPYFSVFRLNDGTKATIVPHPSGLNRWWNLPLNQSEASLFFRSLKETIISELGEKPAVEGPAWT